MVSLVNEYSAVSQGVGGSSQLAAILNNNLLGGLSAVAAVSLDGLHHIHALYHTAEHHMLAIQPVQRATI